MHNKNTESCKRKLIKVGILFVVLPLSLGGILYYLLCPDVFFVRHVDSFLGIYRFSDSLSIFPTLSRFLRNYFFDFIWAFALTNSLYLILGNNAWSCLTSIICSVFLGSAMEILQLTGVTTGTFDVWDIAAEAVGAVTGAIIIKQTWRR